MKREDIFYKVKAILANMTRYADEEITEQSHVLKDLGLDSLDIIETIMEVEMEFDIEIEDDKLPELEEAGGTVGVFVDYLETLINDKV